MTNLHPFLEELQSVGTYSLPKQLISNKERFANKDEFGVSNWEKQCLDALANIARVQYSENMKLEVNGRLVNGEFIPSDYIDCEEEGVVEPLYQMIKEGKISSFVKHYDIISKVINTQVEEFSKYPDTLHVVGFGEKFMSDKMEEQSKLLLEWYEQELELKQKEILTQAGLDLEQEFESEEEKMQFEQEVAEVLKKKGPKEIGDYMKSDYRHNLELWAEYELVDQKFRFNLAKQRREEYFDLLTYGRRFRHLRPTPQGLEIEPVKHVLHVFFQKSADVKYTHKGDYTGQIFEMTPASVITKYGKYLTSNQLEKINGYYSGYYSTEATKGVTDLFGNPVNYLDQTGTPYQKFVPSFNPEFVNLAPFLGLNNNFNTSKEFVVVEAYWKSFEIVWTLCWINPETLMQEVIEVDESFIFPNYIKKYTNKTVVDKIDLNTAIKSYKQINYQGTLLISSHNEKFYINIKKCNYQGTSPFQVEIDLPIVGQVMYNKHTKPSSQVEKLKPYQFQVNIAMNKVTKIQERSFMPFVVNDVRLMPNQKDWGGDDLMAKWFETGQDLGVVPIDTSPSNLGGQGGQFPRVIDIDVTPRIINELNIAKQITYLAYEQIGINPSRFGNVTQSETATGINVGVNNSQNATGSWATEYWECEQDIIKLQLDIALAYQATNQEITKQFVNSNYISQVLKFTIDNANLYDLRIYVVNSQEELRLKKIYEQLGLNMNTLNLKTSDRLELFDSLTPTERIKQIIRTSEEQTAQQEQRLADLEQQKLQATTEAEKARLAQEKEQFLMTLENEKEIAWIKSRGYISAGEQDLDKSTIPDAFEFAKFETKANQDYEKINNARNITELAREKENQRIVEKQKEIDLKQQALNLKKQEIEQTAKNVKILDKGTYNKLTK